MIKDKDLDILNNTDPSHNEGFFYAVIRMPTDGVSLRSRESPTLFFNMV